MVGGVYSGTGVGAIDTASGGGHRGAMAGVGCCWFAIGTRREGKGMGVRVMVRIGVIIQRRGRQIIGIVAASDSA